MTRLTIAAFLLGIAGLPATAGAATILFVGNSFTAGTGSQVEGYRPESVTDLNREGVGGVPALFKAFARQAGLAYDVHLEVAGGMNLDFHHDEKAALIARAWDHVVVQGYSTLDADSPGDARQDHRLLGASRAALPCRESERRSAPGRDLVARRPDLPAVRPLVWQADRGHGHRRAGGVRRGGRALAAISAP